MSERGLIMRCNANERGIEVRYQMAIIYASYNMKNCVIASMSCSVIDRGGRSLRNNSYSIVMGSKWMAIMADLSGGLPGSVVASAVPPAAGSAQNHRIVSRDYCLAQVMSGQESRIERQAQSVVV
jgi:hypothetical protein